MSLSRISLAGPAATRTNLAHLAPCHDTPNRALLLPLPYASPRGHAVPVTYAELRSGQHRSRLSLWLPWPGRAGGPGWQQAGAGAAHEDAQNVPGDTGGVAGAHRWGCCHGLPSRGVCVYVQASEHPSWHARVMPVELEQFWLLIPTAMLRLARVCSTAVQRTISLW